MDNKAPTTSLTTEQNAKQHKESNNEANRMIRTLKVVGDSTINSFEGRGLCKGNHVKVRKHPGASSTDFIDHVKPVLRKTP